MLSKRVETNLLSSDNLNGLKTPVIYELTTELILKIVSRYHSALPVGTPGIYRHD